jgi:DMSO reductase anchor subunit
MRPAWSVVFFTVASGAGLGLLAILALLRLLAARAVPDAAALPMLALALVLTTAGLSSSTFHLANPKNAWRSATRFKTSWLSREAVFAIALYPVALAYGWTLWTGTGGALQSLLGLALAALAVIVLYCTGMIYACLRTIPRWNHGLVPAGYVVLGLYSGLLAGLPVMAAGSGGPLPVALAFALLAAGLAVKGAYYVVFAAPAGVHTIADALPLGKGQVRLLDTGHTHGTFLTDEFFFRLARQRARFLRFAVVVLAFVLPLALLTAGVSGPYPLAFVALSAFAGLLAERWLFFAEAEHTVRLYHGQARVG